MKNSAEAKRADKSRYCKICGTPLHREKDMRRKKCKKCHRLDQRRWRGPKQEFRRITK